MSQDKKSRTFIKKSLVESEGDDAASSGKHIEEQLAHIYENSDGSIPDMSHFEKRTRSRVVRAFFFLLSSCLALGAVVLVGLFFMPQGDFTDESIAFSVSGSERISVGSVATYRVHYKNNQHLPLARAVLSVRYPEGFTFSSSSKPTTNDDHTEWALGTIEPYEEGEIEVAGTLYGSVDDAQSLRAFFTYTPANFSSEFQKVATLETKMTKAPISLTASVPRSVPAQTESGVTFILKKEGPLPQGPIFFELTGGDFRVTKSSLGLIADSGNRWRVPSTTGDIRISVTGTFAGKADDAPGEFGARIVGWRDESRQGDPFVYSAESYVVSVEQTALSATVVVNGGTGDMPVSPGDILATSIAVRNNGETTLSDVAVRLVFEAPSYQNKSFLDWAKAEDTKNGDVVGEQLGPDRRRGSITWTKAQVASLRSLGPQGELTFDVRLPVRSGENTDLSVYPVGNITAVAEVRYRVGESQELFATVPIKLTLQSDARLTVEDTLSTSNDSKTIHTVQWVVNNTFHPLKNIRVEADAYGDITWLDESKDVPAGTLEYKPTEKKIVWTIADMPEGVDVLALQFALRVNNLNPSQTQLVSKVRFKATDTVTGQDIIRVGDEILLSSGEEQVEP